MTIAEFLLARIAEDETEARSVIAEYEQSPPSVYEMAQVPMLDAGAPDRVLDECEAKRRIVEAAHPQSLPLDSVDYLSGAAYGLDIALRALASVYADHPDFDPAWRVAD